MERKKAQRRGLLTALALAALAGALGSPQATFADGDKEKGKKIPIIIQDPIITPDPQPAPPHKKK